MSNNCSFHPNLPSLTTCERCNRPICEVERRVYRQIHYKSDDSSFYTYHDYCLICNATQLKSDNIRSLYILSIIGIILFLIALRVGFPVGLLIIGFMIIGGIAFYIFRLKPAINSEKEVKDFKKALLNSNTEIDVAKVFGLRNNPNSMLKSIFSNQVKFYISCYQCGKNLIPSDRFCPQCGDSTREELSKK